jgi:hypothetical protein
MITYVVVEGESNKQLLEHLLPEDITQHIVIAPASRGNAQVLASSMLMTRKNPVALVVDANTEVTNIIEQRRAYLMQYLGSNLASADSVYEVFIAVPMLEIILVYDKEILEYHLRRPLADEEVAKAKHELLTYIATIIHDDIPNLKSVLIPPVLEKARQHPLIVELCQFIEQNIAEKQPT